MKGRGRMIVLISTMILFVAGLLFLQNEKKRDVKQSDSIMVLSETNIQLHPDEHHHTFVIIKNPDGSQVNITEESKFSTSDAQIVRVEKEGIFKAGNPGSAIITVKYHEYTKKVTVTVKENINLVNVKEFGAVGDGETNDTEAFQKAIDQLSELGGGDVYIPTGTYSLHSIFLKPKINLIGENQDKVTLKLADDAPDGYNRIINMNDHTKVKNLTCDGNYKKHPKGTEHMHCIFAYDHDHITIENNRLINAVGDGISISGSKKASDYVVISNNIVEENQRSQIVIEQVNHLQISNNTITSKTGRPGIHFEPWEERQFYDAKISGNTITTNSEGYCGLLAGSDSEKAGKKGKGYLYHGIDFFNNKVSCPSGVFLIEDTSNINVYKNKLDVGEIKIWRKNKNVHVFQNSISSNVGVRIEGGWDGHLVASGTKIFENTFDTSAEGITIHDGAQNTNIYKNIFTGSGADAGIQVLVTEGVQDVKVSENTFENYHKGFYMDYVPETNKDMNNVAIIENTFKDLNDYAFYIQGPVHKAVMNKNMIINSSGAYMDVHEGYSMSEIKITNNIISNGENGIVQQNSGNGILDGLLIEGNELSYIAKSADGYAAIEIDPNIKTSKNVSIRRNVLNNNEQNRIIYPSSLKKAVKDNQLN
jgi:hypothetical protein